MILDTSAILRILRDRSFFEKLKDRIDEDVKITSITAYELLRGAAYIKLRHGRENEIELVRDLVKSIEVLPFDMRDAEISAAIWARLKEKGYEVNDADVMIAAICVRENEKLLTLDEDFELIRAVTELDAEILEDK